MFGYFGEDEHCIGSQGDKFVRSIAILERRIIVLVTKADLWSTVASEM